MPHTCLTFIGKTTTYLVLTAVPLGLMLFLATPAQAANCTRFSERDSVHLTCDFGLELWEDGKKSDKIFQQWDLSCHFAKGQAPDCSLERTLIRVWPEGMGGIRTTIARHSTAQKTLAMIYPTEWDKGRLDFDVIYERGERMPVVLRLKPSFPGHLMLWSVEAFQAKDSVRAFTISKIVSQEWRIPEYTYTLPAPVVLQGKRSATEKVRDDFLNSLDKRDRASFESSAASCFSFDSVFRAQHLQPLLRDYEGKARALEEKIQAAEPDARPELYPQKEILWKQLLAANEMRDALRRHAYECFSRTGMSATGSQAAADFVLKGLTESR